MSDSEDVLDPSRAHQDGDRRVALVDGPDRLLPVRRVADALVAEPVDKPDVELAFAVDGQLRIAVAVDDGGRAVAGELLKRAEGTLRIGQAILDWQRLGRLRFEDTVRGKDHQPGVLEADEDREHVVALGEREGGFVAMVAVGDQQLPLGEGVGDAGAFER